MTHIITVVLDNGKFSHIETDGEPSARVYDRETKEWKRVCVMQRPFETMLETLKQPREVAE